MAMTFNGETISNGVQLANNLSKLAANLTEEKKKQAEAPLPVTNTNSQPHNQTVEVKLESGMMGLPDGKNPEEKEPVIVKPFPEGRELSERECALEKFRLECEHEREMKELEFRMQREEEARKERRERQEYERKELERRRAENRRSSRNLLIGTAVVGVVLVGCAVADFYTHPRRSAGRGMAVSAPEAISLTDTEAKVE